MRWLAWLNDPRAIVRRTRKAALLAVVALFMLYPNPVLLVRNGVRLLSPNSMIEPGNSHLDALDAQVSITSRGKSAWLLNSVERVVYQRVPYKHDWDNWGCANYLPSVDEVMSRGCADCKGQAVVAASLLARRGVQARLVSDLSHMWVWTPEGELMSPIETASGRKAMTADARGSRIDVLAIVAPRGMLEDMPVRFGYGAGVFPLGRVLIITAAGWVVSLRRSPEWRWSLAAFWAMVAGVICWRVSCGNIHQATPLGAWTGLALTVVGIVVTRRADQNRGVPVSHQSSG